jgi:hypothetical protein
MEFKNPNPEQVVQFVLSNGKEGTINNITLEFDGSKKVLLPLDIPPNHHIKYSGGSYIKLYDSRWNLVDEARVVQYQLMLSQGDHEIHLEADFENASEEASLQCEFRTLGLPDNLRVN